MFVLKELDFRQVSQLRYALELKSFTLAVQNATWQDLADLREIISQLDMEINAYYVDMIQAKMKPGMPTALCTHHVPHVRLNGHEPSHYSFYTGMKDLVHELPFDPLFNNYLICGHTHRRVIGEVVTGFMGVNVGSDYDELKTFTLEV